MRSYHATMTDPCQHCGAFMPGDARYCAQCGESVEDPSLAAADDAGGEHTEQLEDVSDERNDPDEQNDESAPPKASQSGCGVVLAILVVVVILGVCSDTGNDGATDVASDSDSVDSGSVSPAEALAQLDGSPGLASVYQEKIDRLEALCENDGEEHLADLTVTAQRVIREKDGRTVPLTTILDGLAASIPADASFIQCSEVAGAWTAIYLSGR